MQEIPGVALLLPVPPRAAWWFLFLTIVFMQVIQNIPSLDLEAEHKSGLKTHPFHFLIIIIFFFQELSTQSKCTEEIVAH